MKDRDYRNKMEKIRRKVGKAINQYGLIGEDDSVLIGISGGKDSLVLLETVAERRRKLPINYTLYAAHIHIDEIGYEANVDQMQSLCDSLSIPFYKKNISIDLSGDKKKSICFLCSWYRRKALFSLVRELHCTKLALGHHMDDIIETLMLNMVNQGSFGTMPPKLSLFNGDFDIIRPLALLTNDETLYYATMKGFSIEKKDCPHENMSQRNEVRFIIDKMQNLNQRAKRNIYSSMSNIKSEYLPE